MRGKGPLSTPLPQDLFATSGTSRLPDVIFRGWIVALGLLRTLELRQLGFEMSSPTGGSSSAPAQPANPSAPTSNSPDARPEADAGGSDGLIKHERFSPEEEAASRP